MLMKAKILMSNGGGILLKMLFFISLQRFLHHLFNFTITDVAIYILMNRIFKEKTTIDINKL